MPRDAATFDNEGIAAVLDEIGDLLGFKGENVFRAVTYRAVARAIRDLREPVSLLLSAGPPRRDPEDGTVRHRGDHAGHHDRRVEAPHRTEGGSAAGPHHAAERARRRAGDRSDHLREPEDHVGRRAASRLPRRAGCASSQRSRRRPRRTSSNRSPRSSSAPDDRSSITRAMPPTR